MFFELTMHFILAKLTHFTTHFLNEWSSPNMNSFWVNLLLTELSQINFESALYGIMSFSIIWINPFFILPSVLSVMRSS